MPDTSEIDQQILDAAQSNGMPALICEFIVCQAHWESGNYTSKLYNDDNNAFGFDYSAYSAGVPSTKNFNGSVPYASYADVTGGVDDLCAWLDAHGGDLGQITTPQQYADMLAENDYFEGVSAATYGAGLTALDKQLFGGVGGSIDPAGTGAGVTAPAGNAPLSTSVYIPIAVGMALLLILKLKQK